jgi:hypothetical protein
MGRYGGQFTNYQIPYGNGVRVTVLPVTKVLKLTCRCGEKIKGASYRAPWGVPEEV